LIGCDEEIKSSNIKKEMEVNRKAISLVLRGFPLAGKTMYDGRNNKFVHIK